jgi:hypothetical protein
MKQRSKAEPRYIREVIRVQTLQKELRVNCAIELVNVIKLMRL